MVQFRRPEMGLFSKKPPANWSQKFGHKKIGHRKSCSIKNCSQKNWSQKIAAKFIFLEWSNSAGQIWGCLQTLVTVKVTVTCEIPLSPASTPCRIWRNPGGLFVVCCLLFSCFQGGGTWEIPLSPASTPCRIWRNPGGLFSINFLNSWHSPSSPPN